MLKISVLFLVYFFVSVRGVDLRIAGGEIANISRFPFLTALLTNQGSGAFVQKCGGSILTSNAILSAASCFYTDGELNNFAWWRARVGSSNANSGGTVYIINRITAHESFSPSTLVNDIAVLRTNLPISFQSNLIAAASIAGTGYTYTDNENVWAVGWGVTHAGADAIPPEQLRVALVRLINQQTCTSRHSEPQSGFTVTNTMICAGWLDVGVNGQCEGDVGGPLLDASGAVIGVFSYAHGCADLYYPDINTRVASYTPWIIDAARAP
ncbi:hypothetical protein PYW07_009090 [Mythimna separata]|uniref:Peptidase S1 domain-containing protein n=1 Tax=Mythimna separata TaxID=271217 RepID=A0AAD7YBA4_MYTSE|nr:hypothetical protein PYW07_009090 [Mythimna separata]